MAAYWRAVGVYARHTARSLLSAQERSRESIRAACPDCRTPAQSATRSGYTCPRHVELFYGRPMPTVVELEAHRPDGSCHPRLGLGHLLVEARP